jgi:hypothetical protein
VIVRAAAFAGGVLLALAAGAGAQSPVPAPGPRAMAGVVADSGGNPIDSADVAIASLKRRATTGTDGSFRFDKISPGTYDVSARRFGYAPQVRRVVVGANGGVVRFALVPMPHALAPIVSSVARGGLSGVIGDTAFNVVEGATIAVVASDHRAVSDSLGRFFIDLHPGRYMVRVTHTGFVSRMMSVTIPNDSGRRLAVWLAPGSLGEAAKDSWMLDDLSYRLAIRTSMSKLYTREDLSNMPMTELTQITLVGGGIPQRDDCPAFIDGGPQFAPLWSIPAADIETVEIYPPKSLPASGASTLRRPPTTSMRENPSIRAQRPTSAGGRDDCPVLVFVWLRK